MTIPIRAWQPGPDRPAPTQFEYWYDLDALREQAWSAAPHWAQGPGREQTIEVLRKQAVVATAARRINAQLVKAMELELEQLREGRYP